MGVSQPFETCRSFGVSKRLVVGEVEGRRPPLVLMGVPEAGSCLGSQNGRDLDIKVLRKPCKHLWFLPGILQLRLAWPPPFSRRYAAAAESVGLLAIWPEFFGTVSLDFGRLRPPANPLDRRGPLRTSACTKHQPRIPRDWVPAASAGRPIIGASRAVASGFFVSVFQRRPRLARQCIPVRCHSALRSSISSQTAFCLG